MYRFISVVMLLLILVMAAQGANQDVFSLAELQAREINEGFGWFEKEGKPFLERLSVSLPTKQEEELFRFLLSECEKTGSALNYVKNLAFRASMDGELLIDYQQYIYLPVGVKFWESIPGYQKDLPLRYASVEEEEYSLINYIDPSYADKQRKAAIYYAELDIENPPLGLGREEGRWIVSTNEASAIKEEIKEHFPKAEVSSLSSTPPSMNQERNPVEWLLLFLFFFIYANFISLRVEQERSIRLLLGRSSLDTYLRLYLFPLIKAMVAYLFAWHVFAAAFLRFKFDLLRWSFAHLKGIWKVPILLFVLILLFQLIFYLLSEKKRTGGMKATFALPGLIPILVGLLILFLGISLPRFTESIQELKSFQHTQRYLAERPEIKEYTGFNQAGIIFRKEFDNYTSENRRNSDIMNMNLKLRSFLENYKPLVFDTTIATMKEHHKEYKGPPWIKLNQRMFAALDLPLAEKNNLVDVAKGRNILLILPKGKKLHKGDLEMLATRNNKVHLLHLKESYSLQDPTLRLGEVREPYFAVLPDQDLQWVINFPSFFFEKLDEKQREEILDFIYDQGRETSWYLFEKNENRIAYLNKQYRSEVTKILRNTVFSLAFVFTAVWFLELFSYYKSKKELSLHFLLGKNVLRSYGMRHLPLLVVELLVLMIFWKVVPSISLGFDLRRLVLPLVSILALQFIMGYVFFMVILKRGVKYMMVEGDI